MGPLPKTRIMAVEHNDTLRDGLIALIGDEPDLEIVSTPSDAQHALLEFLRVQPHVTIVDVDTPGTLELMRQLRSRQPQVKIIPLVNYEWDSIAQAAVETSGSPCLPKDHIGRRLLSVIRETRDT
ncbi:MAG TPA: response regulator [Bryobacteraceae bacterium]